MPLEGKCHNRKVLMWPLWAQCHRASFSKEEYECEKGLVRRKEGEGRRRRNKKGKTDREEGIWKEMREVILLLNMVWELRNPHFLWVCSWCQRWSRARTLLPTFRWRYTLHQFDGFIGVVRFHAVKNCQAFYVFLFRFLPIFLIHSLYRFAFTAQCEKRVWKWLVK